MAQHPVLPLFTDAYLADTTHLSTIEHGAYLLLLIAMWRAPGKCLPSDDRKIARYAQLTPGQWARMRPTIMAFFIEQGGFIRQGRLSDEAEAVQQRSAKQSKNAKARWQKPTDPSPEPPGKNGHSHLTATNVAVRQDRDASSNDQTDKSLTDKESDDAMALPDRCQTDASLNPSLNPSSSSSTSEYNPAAAALYDPPAQAAAAAEPEPEEDPLPAILSAARIDVTKDISGKWFSQRWIAQRWHEQLGLSWPEITAHIAGMVEHRQGWRPPSTLKFFDAPMQDLADRKTQPALKPTPRPSFDQQRAEAERAAKRLRWQRIAAGGRA